MDCVPRKIGDQDNRMLMTPVNDAEIEHALSKFILQNHQVRMASLLFFCFFFLQNLWEIVGGDVMGMVKCFFSFSTHAKELNRTTIVLIPKVDCPRMMSQFRPISICNVAYKIISKVITNKLKRVLPKVISKNQSAFVTGRRVSNNILVVHELLHTMKHGDEEGTRNMA